MWEDLGGNGGLGRDLDVGGRGGDGGSGEAWTREDLAGEDWGETRMGKVVREGEGAEGRRGLDAGLDAPGAHAPSSPRTTLLLCPGSSVSCQ